ncbi:MAG: CRTAC1 family protein, partial [Planctomycetales bacterium]
MMLANLCVNEAKSPFKIAFLKSSGLVLAVVACLACHGELALAGTTNPPTDAVTSVALETPGLKGRTLFQRLDAKKIGIDFQNNVDLDHRWAHLYTSAFACSGVSVGDYDKDGRPDIFFSSQTGRSRLYRQVGDFEFQDVTDAAGIDPHSKWSAGSSFADVDNDGDLDLYICTYEGRNELYLNQNDGTFIESAQTAGLDYKGASHTIAFADYDNDGDLDAYLLNNTYTPLPGTESVYDVKRVDGKLVVAEHHRRFVYPLARPNGSSSLVAAGDRDCLYRNNGDGTFTDVSKQAGIDTEAYFKGLSATWWDYDNDGDDDLYVANDFFGPDYLYRNNGNGTFTNVIQHSVPHTPWYSMGSNAADINNDGWMDYLATDMAATTHLKQKTIMGDMRAMRWFLESPIPRQYMRNALYLNSGTGRFMEVAALAGLAESDWTWSANFGDLDNDGWVDVFFTNGTPITLVESDYDAELNRTTARMMRRFRSEKPSSSALLEIQKFRWDTRLRSEARPDKNFVFRNQRDLTFEAVGKAWGLDHKGVSYGATFADLDRDGDLDLVVSNINEPHGIYRNTGQDGNRVLVRLVGKQSNRSGIGAVLEARTRTTTQTKRMTTSRAYMSSTEPIVHFGIGPSDRI